MEVFYLGHIFGFWDEDIVSQHVATTTTVFNSLNNCFYTTK